MPKRKNTAISILHVCGGDPYLKLCTTGGI
ncbi:hypothetical protein IMAU60211_01183 [Lactobacillus helveticus]|nr:hypothetical protein [Lactobacillus helveticus]NRO33081.1 hypothetical protein [Lactobacillus helveticus]